MQGSINFDGSLIGNITGGGGGGGDTVVITPVVTSGTKIADVSVNGVEKDLYCPTPPTPPAPTEVDITPVVTSGTKIADVSIGGVEKDLYSPDYGADITALDNRLDRAEDNITSLTGRVGTAEGNITEIKQSLSQLDGLIIYKDLTPTDDYAEFNDGSNLPLLSLISTIEPIQKGSGDPSPTNVRPIIGWDEVDLTVANDVENPTVSNVYTINLDGTRYGGTLDVISGVLTVERASVDLGTLNWTYTSETNRERFSASFSGVKWVSNTTPINAICSVLVVTDFQSVYGHIKDNAIGMWNGTTLAVCSSAYTDATAFTTAMNGVQLVYELATPLTIQLTPTAVNSLLGQNYISSNVGDITNVKYLGILNLS